MKRFLYVLALLAGVMPAPTFAADMTFSTGSHFVPTGPALFKGSDMNVMVDQINTNTAALGGTQTGNMIIGSGVNGVSITGGATLVAPIITIGGASSDTNMALVISGKGTGAVHLGGALASAGSLRVPTVASSVNQVEVSGAVASGIADVTIGGSLADTNAPISLSGKGTGATLLGGQTTTLAGLQIAQTASRVNGLNLVPGATGTSVILNASTAGADTNAGIDITPKGTGIVKIGGAQATCSGTTTATCSGQRFVVTITGLTTAASTLSAAMVVTDTSVASSSSIVICQPQGYAGTGVPIAVNVTPGTSSVSIKIQNVSTGAALNANVAVACVVFD
jgi:hypothetical protein